MRNSGMPASTYAPSTAIFSITTPACVDRTVMWSSAAPAASTPSTSRASNPSSRSFSRDAASVAAALARVVVSAGAGSAARALEAPSSSCCALSRSGL